MLICHGCRLDLADVDGHGALYWTFINKQFDIFCLLLKAGAHINHKFRNFLLENLNAIDSNGNDEEKDLSDWVKNWLKNPPTLLQLSSNKIRNMLSGAANGTSIWPLIDKLQVPQKMKSELRSVDGKCFR